LRILVAESEPDILTLYSDYLSAMGHDVSVTTDYNRCLSLFKKRDFNLVILDTHVVGNSTIGEITKEMMRIEPHQRILLTSTYSSSQITGNIDNPNLDKFQLLQKPFHLSRLLNAIECAMK
jgi:DNA-binding NtrC family response regulator